MNPQHEAEWKEAKQRCRLSDEALRMARQMGLNPRKLVKNIPNKQQQWKASVEDWVRDMYRKRFGARKPEARLPFASKAPDRPPSDSANRSIPAPETVREPAPEPKSGDEPGPNLLREAEQDLEGRFERGEIEAEEFSYAMSQIERETPVSEGEVAQENRLMMNRYRAFRLAAQRIGAAFGKLPLVQKVVLFGSVAAPLQKEVPRFRRLRRERVAIWHECNDIDLAVWVTDLSALGSLKKALSRALNEYQQAVVDKPFPGIPSHQVDVFLFEPRTQRFRGNLCDYAACPRGKPDCEVVGCGAQRFLRLFENFNFDRTCLYSEHNVILFERKVEPAADVPQAPQGNEPPF